MPGIDFAFQVFLPWVQSDDESATSYGGAVYQEIPYYVYSLPPQMRARQRQIGTIAHFFRFLFFCVFTSVGP